MGRVSSENDAVFGLFSDQCASRLVNGEAFDEKVAHHGPLSIRIIDLRLNSQPKCKESARALLATGFQIERGYFSFLISCGCVACERERLIVDCLEAAFNVHSSFTFCILHEFQFKVGLIEHELVPARVNQIDVHFSLLIRVPLHHTPRVEAFTVNAVQYVPPEV